MSDLQRFGAYCRKQAQNKRDYVAHDRALWTTLADEVDAYMAGDPDVIPPFYEDDQQLSLGD